MMIRNSIFLAAALATVLCAPAATARQLMTFSDCVNYAVDHNIDLQKSVLAESTAGLDVEEAKARWQPSLDFATTQGFTNTPWGDGNRNAYNSSYGFNAGWTVWDGGERENSIKQSELRAEINRLNSGNIMRTLQTDLLQVYMNILYARESIAIYEEAVKLSEAQADRARQLMEAGRLSQVDYAQLQSQYEQDSYSLVNARATYDSRRMELKQLLEMGLEADVEIAPVEWTDAEVMAELPPLAESYDLALQTDLKIRALQTGKSASALDVAIARASGMPKISLSAGVGTGYYAPGASFATSMKRNLNETVGLTLAVPILDNKKTKTAVARAKIAEIDAELDIEQRRTELARTVENWYIDTRSARSRLTAALSQLQAATLSNDLTTEKFTIGYVNPVELMTAHKDYVEARHSVLQARFMAMLGQKMIEFYRTSNITL